MCVLRYLTTVALFGYLGGFGVAHAQDFRIAPLQQGHPTSIRGLSVLDDSVAWVSGSDGWVGRTVDRGQTWHWQRVAGHETLDFRDIEVFSADEALILSAGSPLVVLHTSDGGRTWQEAHRDDRPEIFFDGMDFWDNRRGLAYGDPIDGLMQLLATEDGGRTWRNISDQVQIRLADGEAGFAASGTGIRTLPRGQVFVATGGSRSRLFHSADYGRTWRVFECPITQGTSSTGIFSIAFWDARQGVVVGGDYQRDTARLDASYVTSDGGQTWQRPRMGTHGYRSAVEYLDGHRLVAVGSSGVDYSADGGTTWALLSDERFHVARKAKRGTWVLLAGTDGKIAAFTNPKP